MPRKKNYANNPNAVKIVEDVVSGLAQRKKNRRKSLSVRERLIIAALNEVQEYGFAHFSLRRVASSCGVSSAAPYKHFKNKNEIVEAILIYINNDWIRRQDEILEKYAGESIRFKLVELSLEFIRFMVENPQFRTILMGNDETFDSEHLLIKSGISEKSKELIHEYCLEIGMNEQVAMTKMYVVRSLIYGASLMFGNCELVYTDEAMALVRKAIDREFDLPSLVKDGEVVLRPNLNKKKRKRQILKKCQKKSSEVESTS